MGIHQSLPIEEDEEEKKGFDPARRPDKSSEREPVAETAPPSIKSEGPAESAQVKEGPKQPEGPEGPKQSLEEKDRPFEYPKFVENLGEERPPLSSQIMRDVFLRPGPEAMSEMEDFSPEERLRAYRGLATKRMEAGEVPDWIEENAFIRGATYRLWDEIEQTLEKYTKHDFPDVPEYGHDPDSGMEEIGMYVSLLLAGVATSVVATAAGPYLAGAMKVLGAPGVAASSLVGVGSRLVLGRPFVFALLAGGVLKEGTSEGPPGEKYGLVSMGAEILTPYGETKEERGERLEAYPKLSYGGRLWSQTRSEVFDEALFWGGFKGLKYGFKSIGIGSMSKASVKRADSILGGKAKEWAAEHGDEIGLGLQETENFVANAGAAMSINKTKMIKKVMKTPEGKKVMLAYPKLTDAAAPAVVKEVVEETGKVAARISVRPSLQGTARSLMKKVLDGGSLEEVNKLRSRFMETVAEEGFTAPVAQYVERAYVGVLRNTVRKLAKEGRGADLGELRAMQGALGDMIDRALLSVGEAGEGVLKKRGKYLGVADQKTLEVYQQLRERLSGVMLSFDDLQKMPPAYLKFLDNLYAGVADGTVDPAAVRALTSVGGPKGMLQFMGRTMADQMLGTTAVLSTALGNAAGTVDEFFRSSKLFGVRTAATDNYHGLTNVARLVGGKVAHPLETMKNIYVRMSGQAVDHTIHTRALIEEALPSGFFSKMGNMVTGWRFEAIHGIDEVTQAYNANGQARKVVGWLTDHRLAEQGIKEPTQEVFQKEYRKVLREMYEEFSTGKGDTGGVPLFSHFMREGMNKVALRRNLSQKNLTPLASNMFRSVSKVVDETTLQKSEDTILKSLGKFGVRSLMIPFSKTALNVSERSLYAAKGVAGLEKGLGHFAKMDQKAAGEAMSVGIMLYAAEQMADHGVLEMSPPLTRHQDPLKTYGQQEGVAEGHVRVGNRTVPVGGLNVYGAGMLVGHGIHSLINILKEDDPEVAVAAHQALMKFGKIFAGFELAENVFKFVDNVNLESEGSKAGLKKAGKKHMDRSVELMFPMAKTVKNAKEVYTGHKLSGLESEEVDDNTKKTALKELQGFYEYLKIRASNAYGVSNLAQRDYFGRPVRTIHPDEFGGEEGWVPQVARFAIGGTKVVDENSVKFYDKMSELGLFDISSAPIATGEGSPDIQSGYSFTPISGNISAKIRVPDAEGRMHGRTQTISLPKHKFNQMKGLAGLQSKVWVDFMKSLPDIENGIAERVYDSFLSGAEQYGYQDGDDMHDVIQRLALYEGDIDDAPEILYLAYRHTESGADLEGGGNPVILARGDAKDHMLNVAKRKAIVSFYDKAKELGKQMMALDPYVRKRANNAYTALGGGNDGTAVR